MKLIMMAAALMLGGTAVAQTTEEEVQESDNAATLPVIGVRIPAPRNVIAPGNAAPETDARGIPVISAPAEAPAGYNQPAQTVPAGSPMPTVAPPTPAAAGPLPPCTRTVTDRCTQTYERGRAR